MNYFKKELGSIGQLMAAILFNSCVLAAILASFSILVVAPRTMADEVEANLIQSISTFNFPAPDTAGIIYVPYQDGFFLITDSEINEMPIFQGFNVFKVDREGQLLESFSTLSFSDEPTGITVNPTNNHCFFSDDNGLKAVYEIDPGDDGTCLTADDSVTLFPTLPFGSSDPEDLTYGLSSLFIADGVNNKVFRVSPGNNGLFDGVPSGGDDLVSSFDTTSIGLEDPEGIAFDSRNNTLFIVGEPRDFIFQTTVDGTLLRTIDISLIHPLNPAGLALAPSSEDLTITNLYMVARGLDNDDPHTNEPVVENDGMIYELSIPPITMPNQAPLVSAGDDQWIVFPSTTLLTGSISDDELPSNAVTSIWSKQSGPGDVSFTEPNNLNTTASFSMAGTYILRLTGNDGELTNFDELSILVTSFTSAPGIRNVPSEYPTIQDAFSSAVAGDTIVLAPGTYQMNETLYINKNNISIVSNYLTSGDESDIDSTIIQGDQTMSFIQGVVDQSANLKLIGLTIIDADKGVTFTDDYGEVHYCKFYNTLRDAISFDSSAGGAVTHTRVEDAGDDAIDIDTRYNGSFLIAYNELINSGDDSIEIHLFNSVSSLNMHHDIHDNLLSGAGEDGIQLIDSDAYSNRTFDIYRNIFKDMPDVAIGAMFEETKEDFQGAPMAERVRIYNNYFYNNGYHITGGDNMIILNNIFEAATTAAIKRAKGDSISDYNLFYNNPLDTQDTVTGSTNLYTNPQSNSDFTLLPNSPAINAGTSNYSHLSELVLQVPSSEYTGQNPDIGRYEYDLDNTPVITLLGDNPMLLHLGDTYNEPGATATDNPDGDLTHDIVVSSNLNTAVAGNYQITYSVSDSDGNSALMIRTIVVSDGASQSYVLQSRIAASADDAEESPSGKVYLNSSDIELLLDHDIQTVGLRFTNLSIPENAIITKAYIQFKVDEISTNSTQIMIHGESSANASGFGDTINNISERSTTITSTEWSPAVWSTIGAAGEDQRSADLSSIVQEIITQTGWSSGNAITFIVTGTGKRVAEAYDGDQAGAPLLYVEYTMDASNVAPVITLLGDNPMNLNIGDTFTDPGATATDNPDGDLTDDIEISSNVNTSLAGAYQVTYTVSDIDGNTALTNRSVIVNGDTVAPVITLYGDNPLLLNIGDTFDDPGAIAMDNLDGDLTDDIVSSSNVNTAVAGSYQVTYTVSDASDNVALAIRSVLVSGGTSQSFVVQSRIAASADDAEESPSGKVYINSSDIELLLDHDIQTVGLRFTNLSIPENAIITKAYIQFKVDETSTNSTQIMIHGESSANASGFGDTINNISERSTTTASAAWSPEVWVTIGAAGEDQRSADLSLIVQEIIYQTGWSSGNAIAFIVTGTGKRVAEAYDGDQAGAPLLYVEYTMDASNVAPVIALLGDNPMNLNIGDTFTDPGATATDNPDGDLTDDIEISSNVNTAVAGSYQVTYTVSDIDGNTALATRSVIVNGDTVAPMITLYGDNPLLLNIGDTFDDPGAIAMDNLDGDLTDDIVSSSNVNTAVAGSYQVTYTVSDASDNVALAIRSVLVSDGTSQSFVVQSRIAASADDAEESPSGKVYLNSSDIELLLDKDIQTVGLRFTNLSIPENAIITKAYIQFKVDETSTNSTQIMIHGESSANAFGFGFGDTINNISDRSTTTSSVAWSPAVWVTIGAAGEDQRSADLSLIVQEIISQTGWSSGNAIAFIVTGTGKRVAEAYDGDQAGAPLLYVEYTMDASNIAPMIALLGDNPMNLNIGDIFTDPGATATDNPDGDLTDDIEISSNVNTAVAGNYQVTYTVSDIDGNTALATRNVLVSDGTSQSYVLQSRIAASADDAEESPSGKVYLNSSDIELLLDHDIQTVGLRFTALSIPKNALISKAYIQFKVDETSTDSTLIMIHGESSGNAAGFHDTINNISERTTSTASASWSPGAWSNIGEAGEEQRSADLSAIVQEVVYQTGWGSGNAIVFIINGTGKRVAEAYDGDPAGAPLLYVEYTY